MKPYSFLLAKDHLECQGPWASCFSWYVSSALYNFIELLIVWRLRCRIWYFLNVETWSRASPLLNFNYKLSCPRGRILCIISFGVTRLSVQTIPCIITPVLALYDPFGVDVPLNLDITHNHCKECIFNLWNPKWPFEKHFGFPQCAIHMVWFLAKVVQVYVARMTH